MPGRGTFYALSEMEDRLFCELRSDKGRGAFVWVVCQHIRKPWWEHVDKYWDPIHRCLTDGDLCYGREPLYRCVLGTKNYLGESSEQFLNYVKPEDVPRVSAALEKVDQEFFWRNYEKIDQDGYTWEKGEEDFQDNWDCFKRVRRFYGRAAKENRSVLFYTMCL